MPSFNVFFYKVLGIDIRKKVLLGMNLLILEHNNFSLYVSNHVCQMVAEVLSALQ